MLETIKRASSTEVSSRRVQLDPESRVTIFPTTSSGKKRSGRLHASSPGLLRGLCRPGKKGDEMAKAVAVSAAIGILPVVASVVSTA
jgi:hypothetical protein